MKFITVSELKNKATQIISELQKTKGELIITKNGKPVVLMELISEDAFMLREKAEESNKKTDTVE